MRRVVRAFQVEYKNSRKRSRRPGDNPLCVETVASVFGSSPPSCVAEAAGRLQRSEQSAKTFVIKESVR